VNTKTIGAIIAFATLATVLNLVRIPAPYLLYFSYQLGDIILVIAFLLLGIKKGFLIAVLNMCASIAISPSIITLIGGPYYMVSVLTMVLGVYLFEKLIRSRIKNKQASTSKATTISTLISIVTRTVIMLPLDYYVFGFLVSVASGLSIADSYSMVLASMPLIIFYNITVPIYVVTISYIIADKVPKHIESSLFADSFIKK
jgi:riboflavin transporter FmnP